MTEINKLAWPVASSDLITIQSVSQGPASLIFIICAKARAVTSRTIPKFAAEVTQFRQPNGQTLDTLKSYGRPCNVSVISNWIHPSGNPRGNFFERANPGHSGNFFLSNSLSRGKNDGRIPGSGAKFSQTRRNCSLSLQKILRKLRKLRDSTNFLSGELNKTLYFRLKQNHSKVFEYSSLDIRLKQ